MKKVRWGIAGSGRIANKFAKAIQNVTCAELVAVASHDKEKATAFADLYHIPNVFCGYEEMANFDSVDVIYVSTPPHLHKHSAEIFLNTGKHVLCEKPICVNASQATAMKECADRNNVFLMEAMWTKFLPAINEACSMVRSGQIGEVLSISADFSCCLSGDRTERRVFQNKYAGGALLDIGVYGLHFVDLIMDSKPECILPVAKVENGVDVHTHILMQYSSGAIASVSCSFEVDQSRSAYIYGTKGYIHIPFFYGASELFVHVGSEEEHIVLPSIGDGFEEEIYEVCNCIMEGKKESDIHPMSGSIEILRQCDEIRKQIGVCYPLEGENY